MYKITITKVTEDQEQTITRNYDQSAKSEVLQNAVMEIIEQLEDTRSIEDILRKKND